MLTVIQALSGLVTVAAWPGLKSSSCSTRIGPMCTVGAHNADLGDCPTMKQPDPPKGSREAQRHFWPESFLVEWEMSFIPDLSAQPPYVKMPSTPMNVTRGRTSYHMVSPTVRSMREDYESFCIPVFGPFSSNDFGCSFINPDASEANGTSYVVFDDRRPADVPECCVIGQPFHPPPQNFSHGMPLHYRDDAAGQTIDWSVVWDKDAGPFAYGFNPNSTPAVFYMQGVLAMQPVWMYQVFSDFRPGTVPPGSTWALPESCAQARACPGWEPTCRRDQGKGVLLYS